MVRFFFIIIVVSNLQLVATNIFKKECVGCHRALMVDLEDMYFKYLKKYSSEKSVKLVMAYYLKNPIEDISVMSKEYIRFFGIKSKSMLDDFKLKKAVDIYWQTYDVRGRLK
jgi:hypothetical protein